MINHYINNYGNNYTTMIIIMSAFYQQYITIMIGHCWVLLPLISWFITNSVNMTIDSFWSYYGLPW